VKSNACLPLLCNVDASLLGTSFVDAFNRLHNNKLHNL